MLKKGKYHIFRRKLINQLIQKYFMAFNYIDISAIIQCDIFHEFLVSESLSNLHV